MWWLLLLIIPLSLVGYLVWHGHNVGVTHAQLNPWHWAIISDRAWGVVAQGYCECEHPEEGPHSIVPRSEEPPFPVTDEERARRIR